MAKESLPKRDHCLLLIQSSAAAWAIMNSSVTLGIYWSHSMDNFVIAVLTGASVVVLVLLVMILIDKKGKPSAPPANAPVKPGKR